MFFYPVESLIGLTNVKENNSSHLSVHTLILPFGPLVTSSQCSYCAVLVMCVQMMSVMWFCCHLKTLFFSASRNFSFIDLKLILQMFFPSACLAFSIYLTCLWETSLQLQKSLKLRPNEAAQMFKALHENLENIRLLLGMVVLLYLVSVTRLFKSKQSGLKLYEQWFFDRLVTIPHKRTLVLSGVVLVVGLCQVRSFFPCQVETVITSCATQWSVPEGILLLTMSRVVFFVKKAPKQHSGLTVRQREKVSLITSLWSVLRAYSGKLGLRLLDSLQYGSLQARTRWGASPHYARHSPQNQSSHKHDSLKRYRVPLQLECLMDELEKQVDELMSRTMTLASQLNSAAATDASHSRPHSRRHSRPLSVGGGWFFPTLTGPDYSPCATTASHRSSVVSHSPYRSRLLPLHSLTDTEAENANDYSPLPTIASMQRRAISCDQNEICSLGKKSRKRILGSKAKLHSSRGGEDVSASFSSSPSHGFTLMQLRLLASSTAKLDDKSRDNVLECLEEVVYNRLCGHCMPCESLFEKEFELQLLLDYLMPENESENYLSSRSVGIDMYSSGVASSPLVRMGSRRSNGTGVSSRRSRSHSAAALVALDWADGGEEGGVGVGAKGVSGWGELRSVSSEDKLSVLSRAAADQPDGLVQPIKIVYPSSSYEKSKTVKLHRLCQESVHSFHARPRPTDLANTSAVEALAAGIRLQQLHSRNNTRSQKQRGVTTADLKAESACTIELRDLSANRTKLHRTRTLKGGLFLDKL